MGINLNGLRLLLTAREMGADFRHVATIGRQGLHMTPQEIRRGFRDFGMNKTLSECERLKESKWADFLLKELGAETVESFDNSTYEGASAIHDFNLPLPEQWHGRFSLVIDGGSLEHVYNISTALENCIKLLAVGGTYLGSSPCNNYMGHGFYQLSPELFFRAFNRERGMVVEQMWFVASRKAKLWYTIPDSAKAGWRVGVIGARPSLLHVLAKRLELRPITDIPQQSEYIQVWKADKPATKKATTRSGLVKFIPEYIKFVVRAMFGSLLYPREVKRFHVGH